MVKLINTGKAVGLGTSFSVVRDGVVLGTAYRADSGERRGNYSFGDFHGSRARLIAHAESLSPA